MPEHRCQIDRNEKERRLFSRTEIATLGAVAILGFLPQWPTFPTLVMFPILTFMYVARVSGKRVIQT